MSTYCTIWHSSYILFICALASVLCILSLRLKVIVTDVKLREREKAGKQRTVPGSGHRGQKPSQALPCGVVLTKAGPLIQRTGGGSHEPLGFRNAMCTEPDVLAQRIPAFQTQTGRKGVEFKMGFCVMKKCIKREKFNIDISSLH